MTLVDVGKMTDREVMVGAVDDHPAILSGLRAELHAIDPGQRFVRAASTVDGLLAGGIELDVVLLDLRLGDGSRPGDNTRRICRAGARVLVYTDGGSDAMMREAMAAGALGIVLKDRDVITVADAVRSVSRGDLAVSSELAAALQSSERLRPSLSERERQVLELYAGGLPAKSVARRLGVQIGTAKVYLKRIRAKYAALERGAGTRIELYQRAVEDGFILAPREEQPGGTARG